MASELVVTGPGDAAGQVLHVLLHLQKQRRPVTRESCARPETQPTAAESELGSLLSKRLLPRPPSITHQINYRSGSLTRNSLWGTP